MGGPELALLLHESQRLRHLEKNVQLVEVAFLGGTHHAFVKESKRR